MSEVATNKTQHNYAVESSLGTQPTSGWKQLEPNSVPTFGASITTKARNPISKKRRRRKGAIIDLDSSVELETDFTRSAFRDFIEGFMYCSLSTLQGAGIFEPSSVDGTDDEFDVSANGDVDQYTLLYARGFTNSENNGLHIAASGSTGTAIAVETDLVDETPPGNAEVAVAGHTAAAGDIEIDANGDLITTSEDMTDWGLTVGQYIYLPKVGSTGGFALSGNQGLARVTNIAANKLTLEKKGQSFQTDDGTDTGSGGTGQQIYVLFGQFIRDVDTDDSDFLEQSYHFEQVLADLQSSGSDMYRYAKGNYANEMQISLPLTDLATCRFSFVGTDTDNPVASGSRATGASSAKEQNSTAAYGTPSNIGRLHITQTDETEVVAKFTNATMTIRNGVTPQKILGTLGANSLNLGNFEVDVDAEVLLADDQQIASVRSHETMEFLYSVRNDDGGAAIDLPACTMGDGALDLPENETVKQSLTIEAHEDETLGYSLGISLFPYMPSLS